MRCQLSDSVLVACCGKLDAPRQPDDSSPRVRDLGVGDAAGELEAAQFAGVAQRYAPEVILARNTDELRKWPTLHLKINLGNRAKQLLPFSFGDRLRAGGCLSALN